MTPKTISGVAPPSFRSAPGATVVDGRYRFSLSTRVLEKPIAEVTLTDVRIGIDCALSDASKALRDRRYDDADKYVQDARLLSRALRRLEARDARIVGGK